MDIGNRLRKIRKDHKLNQADVAEILNTTQQQYSKYENNTHEVPIRHIITLCHYYKVSSDQILGIANERVDDNVNALHALEYIETTDFSSYTDFLQKAQKDGKIDFLNKALGKQWTYSVVAEKLGIKLDPLIISELNEVEY